MLRFLHLVIETASFKHDTTSYQESFTATGKARDISFASYN
jgi:hypothetical protein